MPWHDPKIDHGHSNHRFRARSWIRRIHSLVRSYTTLVVLIAFTRNGWLVRKGGVFLSVFGPNTVDSWGRDDPNRNAGPKRWGCLSPICLGGLDGSLGASRPQVPRIQVALLHLSFLFGPDKGLKTAFEFVGGANLMCGLHQFSTLTRWGGSFSQVWPGSGRKLTNTKILHFSSPLKCR